ncbi:hypothetical protein HZS_8093 [Henneguya salminicola]|nr:hypothetical protein HZS_8093 [Henneguya salminicola]
MLFSLQKALHRKLEKYRERYVPPSLWNISAGIETGRRNRTNNALERYNRRLNHLLANSHEIIPSFVEIIRDEFLYFEERQAEVRLNSHRGVFRPRIR